MPSREARNGDGNGHAPVIGTPLADQLPPYNLEAERGVLGSILMDPGVLVDVQEAIRDPGDFYRASHQVLYRAILDLDAEGVPVDVITLVERLERKGDLARAGGNDGIAEIMESVPHAANARYYARIVRQDAVIRALIDAAARTLADAYSRQFTAEELSESAEQRVFAAVDDRGGSRTVESGELLVRALGRVGARAEGVTAGLPTGYPELDALTDGLRPGQLIYLAARPGLGKSAWALNLAEHLAGGGTTTYLVSLEMSAEEIGDRLLISGSRVDASRIRTPRYLTTADLDALAQAVERNRRRPILMEDGPSAALGRICSDARRAVLRRGVGLVIVDYLQLIDAGAGERGENRQEQVSRISRRLKTLAEQLRVPVLALSQLNRDVERREERRPRMADLRECITADTPIYCSHSGRMVPVGDYIRSHHSPVFYGLDDRTEGQPWKVHRTLGEPFWSTGIKPVYRVRTATGRIIRCTANHPFRTISGWKPLDDLRVGRRVAVPRFLPEPMRAGQSIGIHPDNARLLGYLISDGTYLKHRSVGYVKADPVLVGDVRRIAYERFGIEAKDHPCPGPAEQIELTGPPAGPGCNPLINWLKEIGIHGQKGHEKRIPGVIFESRNEIVAEFLGSLWAGDGSVVPRKKGGWYLKYSSTSMELLREIQMLLLRFGIISLVGKPERNTKSTVDIATLSIQDSREICRFRAAIRIPGLKGEKLDRAAAECSTIGENSRIDRLPHEVGVMVAAAKAEAGFSWRTLGYRVQGKEICPTDLARVATTLGDGDLGAIAASDVLWDRIESIEPDGEEEVFDVRSPALHNFVAGGIFVHNSGSLEQDANLVLLLHRPDYYDPADRPGEAELIVAKNRGGRTGTVKLTWMPHRMRFEPFAPAEAAPIDDQEPF